MLYYSRITLFCIAYYWLFALFLGLFWIFTAGCNDRWIFVAKLLLCYYYSRLDLFGLQPAISVFLMYNSQDQSKYSEMNMIT